MTWHTWAVVTVIGGVIGWGLYRGLLVLIGRHIEIAPVSRRWLAQQEQTESKASPFVGTTWWLTSERVPRAGETQSAHAKARRRRWVQDMKQARQTRKERAS